MGRWSWSRHENIRGEELEKVTLDRDEWAKILKKARPHQGLSSQWWWWWWWRMFITAFKSARHDDDDDDEGSLPHSKVPAIMMMMMTNVHYRIQKCPPSWWWWWRRFITAFKSARHLSLLWARLIQSKLPHELTYLTEDRKQEITRRSRHGDEKSRKLIIQHAVIR